MTYPTVTSLQASAQWRELLCEVERSNRAEQRGWNVRLTEPDEFGLWRLDLDNGASFSTRPERLIADAAQAMRRRREHPGKA